MRKVLLGTVICLCLSVVVFAHPGKTDSKGGHTDHSTGEYHYHHGYPEHQHSDMDGDGILDCPYNFVDKTDSSNDIAPANPSPSKTKETNWKEAIYDYFLPIACCFALYGVILIVDEIKWRFKK